MSTSIPTTEVQENASVTAEVSGEAGTGEVSHEVTLFAEPIFHMGSFTVTNSLLNSWLAVFLLLLLAILVNRTVRRIPRGIQILFEMIIEAALKLVDSVTNDRKKSLTIFPIVFSVFLF